MMHVPNNFLFFISHIALKGMGWYFQWGLVSLPWSICCWRYHYRCWCCLHPPPTRVGSVWGQYVAGIIIIIAGAAFPQPPPSYVPLYAGIIIIVAGAAFPHPPTLVCSVGGWYRCGCCWSYHCWSCLPPPPTPHPRYGDR